MALDKTLAALNGDDDVIDAPFQASPEELEYLDMLKRKLQQQRAPRYTPEQVAERKRLNERDYALGMMGMASQNEMLQGIGKQMYSEALEARKPHITEHGSYDNLSGEFTYDPDYEQQRAEDQYGQTLNRIGQQRATYEGGRQSARERAQQKAQGFEYGKEIARITAGNRPDKLTWGVDPKTGQVMRVPDEPGVVRPEVGGGQPSEDERKAAGWADQAYSAWGVMKDAITKSKGKAAMPKTKEKLLGTFIPGHTGDDLAYASMSPQRQRFVTAASSFSEAALRAATGAGQNEAEARQKIMELTPRWGESDEAIADKEQRLQMYLTTLKTRAGRAPTAVMPNVPKGTNFPKAREAQIDPNAELPE